MACCSGLADAGIFRRNYGHETGLTLDLRYVDLNHSARLGGNQAHRSSGRQVDKIQLGFP